MKGLIDDFDFTYKDLKKHNSPLRFQPITAAEILRNEPLTLLQQYDAFQFDSMFPKAKALEVSNKRIALLKTQGPEAGLDLQAWMMKLKTALDDPAGRLTGTQRAEIVSYLAEARRYIAEASEKLRSDLQQALGLPATGVEVQAVIGRDAQYMAVRGIMSDLEKALKADDARAS